MHRIRLQRTFAALLALLALPLGACVYSFDYGAPYAATDDEHRVARTRFGGHYYDGYGYYVSRPGVPVLIWVGGGCPPHLHPCLHPPQTPPPDVDDGGGMDGGSDPPQTPPDRPRLDPLDEHVPAGRAWRARPAGRSTNAADTRAATQTPRPSAAPNGSSPTFDRPIRPRTAVPAAAARPRPGPAPGSGRRGPAAEHHE